MSFLGGLVSGGLSLLGGILGGNSAASAQRATNVANAKQAQLEREYGARQASIARRAQEGMNYRQWKRVLHADNTKYQRTMADMERAGLNPILAYQQGGGSAPGYPSTGGISSARGAGARMESPGALSSQLMMQGLQGGISSAMQAMQTEADLSVKEATAKKILAEVETTKTVADLNRVLRSKNFHEITNVQEQNNLIKQTITNMGIEESKLREELIQLQRQGVFGRAALKILEENPELSALRAVADIFGIGGRRQ